VLVTADWRRLCRGPNLELDGDEVIVRFENGRSHRVRLGETDETFELHCIVARSTAEFSIPALSLRIWQLNRAAQLVSFRIDARDRVVGSGWMPRAGATAQEFQLVLRRVAVESDRLEFLLTGKDRE
jgi:hypothetical protein